MNATQEPFGVTELQYLANLAPWEFERHRQAILDRYIAEQLRDGVTATALQHKIEILPKAPAPEAFVPALLTMLEMSLNELSDQLYRLDKEIKKYCPL